MAGGLTETGDNTNGGYYWAIQTEGIVGQYLLKILLGNTNGGYYLVILTEGIIGQY